MNPQKENLLPLKMLTISLGVILVGGFGVLAAQLITGTKSTESKACVAPAVLIPKGAKVASVSVEKGKLVLGLSANGTITRLLTVDACTGAVLGETKIGEEK